MNTKITIRQNTALTSIDPYEAFADAAIGVDAELAKFVRGKWSIGRDNLPVKADDRFLAGVTGLRWGHIRWEGGRPTARQMVLVEDHPQPPSRNELGELDKEEWPTGRDGEPADPWVFTYELPLVDFETGAARLYPPSSVGGRQCVGKLARSYAQHRRKHPGELPVVTLGSKPYPHPTYGSVDNPVLEVVAWVPDPDWMPPSKPGPSVRIAPNARARREAPEEEPPPVSAYADADNSDPDDEIPQL